MGTHENLGWLFVEQKGGRCVVFPGRTWLDMDKHRNVSVFVHGGKAGVGIP